MNKITILAKNKKTYFLKRLTEEVGEGGVCLFDPFTERWDRDLTDFILCRTTGVYGGSEDLEFLKTFPADTRIINSLSSLETFRSKVSQYQFFIKNQLPHLPWLDLRGAKNSDLLHFMDKNPFKQYLIKPHRGQGGWGIQVFLPADLLQWFSHANDLEFLLQPYIEKGRELRYFFVGEWGITLERFSTGEAIAANFQAEGEARMVPTPEFLPKIIKGVRDSLDLHYGAMDVLVTVEGPFILEINTVPGIEQLEVVTGLNVMQTLLESFKIR